MKSRYLINVFCIGAQELNVLIILIVAMTMTMPYFEISITSLSNKIVLKQIHLWQDFLKIRLQGKILAYVFL